ncbi:MAG TPA: hypothetical protein VLG50_04030 [Candidatus Saccharimonadales bacterium]|nr:hypothetical protein [Candidatus Saccharimonadales bacterium]
MIGSQIRPSDTNYAANIGMAVATVPAVYKAYYGNFEDSMKLLAIGAWHAVAINAMLGFLVDPNLENYSTVENMVRTAAMATATIIYVRDLDRIDQ